MLFAVSVFFLLFNLCFSYPYFDICSSLDKQNNITILDTLSGKIKGECYEVPVNFALKPIKRAKVLTWLSVPYSEAPINEKRFSRPEPIRPWKNKILDGTKWPNWCSQPSVASFKPQYFNISEDCLYLNIFTPYKASKTPILVWIHGGSFTSGSSVKDYFEPSTLVAIEDIIVVTINYRLGPLGFLHLAETEATGNQGFLDQYLALKWIYENAHTFGGDNKRITISGQSAGSISVNYHMVFKPSWAYFRNAILQSGTSIMTTLPLISSQEATQRALGVSEITNCYSRNNTNFNNKLVLECLKSINTDKLFEASDAFALKMYANNANSLAKSVTFFPLVLNGIEFHSSVESMLQANDFKQCNIINGVTSRETSIFLAATGLFGSNPTEYEKNAFINKKNFELFIRSVLEYFPYYPLKPSNEYIEKVFKTYVTKELSENATANYFDLLARFGTDLLFRCPALKLDDFYSSFNDVWTYSYDYRISTTIFPEIYQATHSDEIPMVFAESLSIKKPPLITENYWSSTLHNYSIEERLFSEKIVKYWSNFVRSNDPNSFELEYWHKFKTLKSGTIFSQIIEFFASIFNIQTSRTILSLNGNSIKNINYNRKADTPCNGLF